MKNYIIIFFTSLIFFACQNNKETKSEVLKIEKKSSSFKEEISDVLYSKNDTILKFVSNSNGYGVFHWGIDNKFNNIGKDSLRLDNIDRDIVKIKNSFIYTNSCGSACTYSSIMSIKKSNKAMTVMYPLIKDEDLGYLVAKGDDQKVLLSIIDLTNSEINNIKGEFDRTKIPPSLAIDTVYINNSKLSFKWYDKNSKLNFRDIDLRRN